MTMPLPSEPSRRRALKAGFGLSLLGLMTIAGGGSLAGLLAPEATNAQTIAPDATCSGSLTPTQTEGPYYKAGSPERTSLLDPGMAGTRLVLSGSVLDPTCQPIPGAWIDVWQADASGTYDNRGYTLRGHQYADENGRYQLETILPGLYTGRTEHIHVKVQAPNGPVLTTQLYFPDQATRNARDPIFDSALLLPIRDAEDGSKLAEFSFVLNRG